MPAPFSATVLRYINGHRRLDVSGTWVKKEKDPGPQPVGRPKAPEADTDSGGETPPRAAAPPGPPPSGADVGPLSAGYRAPSEAPSAASSGARRPRPDSPEGEAGAGTATPPPKKAHKSALDKMVAAGRGKGQRPQ